MKKLTAALLLSISLFSCKKETKTLIKTDPKTGKQVKVEVPTNPEDSLAAVQKFYAVQDSAGIYKQKFLLQKGKSYPFVTQQKATVTLTAPNGAKQTMTSDATDDVSFTVNEIKNNIYYITIKFLRKRTAQSGQGQSISIDTNGAAPQDADLKNKWTVDTALTGNELAMQMDMSGKILSISGFDAVYKKIDGVLSGIVKDAKIRKAILDDTKNSFNEKILTEQFTKNTKVFPVKGARIGDKWSLKESPAQGIEITTIYSLKKVDNGIVEISVTGGIPKKSDKQTQNGVTRAMSSELLQNGTIKIDQATGWIKNQDIHVKTTQTESLSDGKQSQSMSSINDTHVIVNP